MWMERGWKLRFSSERLRYSMAYRAEGLLLHLKDVLLPAFERTENREIGLIYIRASYQLQHREWPQRNDAINSVMKLYSGTVRRAFSSRTGNTRVFQLLKFRILLCFVRF